jgi:hypothetical protein
VTGTVRDPEGKPIAGARVCHFQEETKVEIYCIETNALGEFETIDSNVNVLRVSAPGRFPVELPAAGHHEVVLERSPTLLVRLVDAVTGEPIERGEVFVLHPSAGKKGPFPANRAGVRITRLLQPGEVKLVGRADGYRESEPLSVTLERGFQSEATLKLEPLGAGNGD